MVTRLIQLDPWLEPYESHLAARQQHCVRQARRILAGKSVAEFALGYLYYGLHRTDDGWVLREWLPQAVRVVLVGDMNSWRVSPEYEFVRHDEDWILELPADALEHGMQYKLHVYWGGGDGLRIPAYARYVVQDESTKLFAAEVWAPTEPYTWHDSDFTPVTSPPLIYEAHVGMSSEDEGVASYRYFADEILPRIKHGGYNTVQLMAVAEHPYYGSFGYHVSSYFAPSSRFGTPDDLKYLVDTAHELGLSVIMDIVHSHSVKNESEGLSRQDGTYDQYFHKGERGRHRQWDSRTFDYGKPSVSHFLLSNVRYWLEEFHMDGYRFDGVTSMLYHSHGLERDFAGYDDYFSADTDLDAVAYVAMANAVAHTVKPKVITIAEDMSAMPGLAAPIESGGIGFDYRLSMGVPDMWVKLVKHVRDEDWDLANILHEVTAHRPEERTISYVESHDQALVGDKTLLFRLSGPALYDHMSVGDSNADVARAVSVIKLIRLLTATTNSGGYLNFMGNEFGHPEWIDFPRAGNDWSYAYARRQWHLADDSSLKYAQLSTFDRALTSLLAGMSDEPISYTYIQQNDNIVSYARGDLLCVYNFSPTQSQVDYEIPARNGVYRVVLSSDDKVCGGQGRIDDSLDYIASGNRVKLYVPARTAVVLRIQ